MSRRATNLTFRGERIKGREVKISTGEKRRGQPVMARRTNWVAALSPLRVEGGVPLVVTDHYQYSGLGGRVSKKTTSLWLLSGGQSFTSEYTYGPLGDIASIDYPAGNWPHQTAPSRQIEYERRLGFLTEVPGYASSITFARRSRGRKTTTTATASPSPGSRHPRKAGHVPRR